MASTNSTSSNAVTAIQSSNSGSPSAKGQRDELIVEQRRQEMQVLLEENQELKERLGELKQVLNDVYKENSLLKMKSIVTLGSMKLEIDSLREDRYFLIEKYHDLKRKIEESTNDLTAKEQEWNALKAVRRERTNSI